ncbi:T9SS type A sorting domain-containing protein [Leadbetterella byssophila]|jgi:hypothetical protein|uniref:Secretion system C-terminal sorting domain-containing protein n=1 Tax=Leadbetterella byssophila (strain DSM 17132 / JCM 16389 / KACC 11308 / NBRC 106382 / 4M15) TaxID=649349 RepID=E4RXA0_LEAB4|nr:T9SS type A sorting domain-containing protein [Leadbetterella byssophila]ADQ19015.1 hypothetical protein Lbys_3364 [Leadbetterella byssophila DSM 17132]
MKKLIVLLLLAAPVLGQDRSFKSIHIERRGGPEKSFIRVETDINGKKEVEEFEIPSDSLRKSIRVLVDSTRALSLRLGDPEMWEKNARIIRKGAEKGWESGRLAFAEMDRHFPMGFSLDGLGGVQVYPNKPNNHILNVRFRAKQKDDVSIVVVNPQGKVIKKEEIKGHEGEYMGQIELPKNTKGTLFVLISQGDSAVSKTVKLD